MASLERRSTGLLDVVPWAYGFSHSWALRSLLLDPVDAEALLAKLPRIGTPPLQIEGDVIRESRLTGTRADLRFDVLDAEATPIPVAVETKVNDPYRVDQIERYIRHGLTPVLLLPGLTGVLLEPGDRTAPEVRLYGRDLVEALEERDRGEMLNGYLRTVRQEVTRIDLARQRVRGNTQEAVPAGECPATLLEDAAWLADTYAPRWRSRWNSSVGCARSPQAASPRCEDRNSPEQEVNSVNAKHKWNREVRRTTLLTVALAAALVFGAVALASGDWIPGTVIVVASMVGLAGHVPVIRKLCSTPAPGPPRSTPIS